jgi:hypothetical protein
VGVVRRTLSNLSDSARGATTSDEKIFTKLCRAPKALVLSDTLTGSGVEATTKEAPIVKEDPTEAVEATTITKEPFLRI